MEMESGLVERILTAGVVEQRRARRWKMFFRFSLLGLVAAMFVASKFPAGNLSGDGDLHTAVVRVQGEITDMSANSSLNINKALRKAVESKSSKAVLLYINSPGGSPVQSGQVADEIHRLRALNPDKPIYAVIGDLGASGGYYIASAAQNIYADKSSLVGSIGVTAANFGYVDLMAKLGVERRAYTSGEHKAFLDPFQPEKPDETIFWASVLNTTHDQFIDEVKKGRGDRLKGTDASLFSGLIWTGEQAKQIGLIDELGSLETVARDVVKAEKLVDYTFEESKLDLFARKLGTSAAASAAESLGLNSSFQLR
jgi:protease-4